MFLAGFSCQFDGQYKRALVDKLPKYQEVLSDHCVQMSLKKPDSGDKYKNLRIPNPTVHIAFNQLRLLVNDIIKVYGKPFQIVFKTAGDLSLGAVTKKELKRVYKASQTRRDNTRKAVRESSQEESRANLLRYRLWEEQKGICIYSGKKIPKEKLYTSELEVDHILPFFSTLDDGFSNKVLVYKFSNHNKFSRTPFEFFSESETHWRSILDRVKKLPKNKRWRFNKNAIEVFLKGEKDFLTRQLSDTRYISKYVKNYLERICGEVWTVRSQALLVLRYLLQIRKQNGDDYRSHAGEALLVGLMDRYFLQHISHIAKSLEKRDQENLEGGASQAFKKRSSSLGVF